jgi:hypothetical protein
LKNLSIDNPDFLEEYGIDLNNIDNLNSLADKFGGIKNFE